MSTREILERGEEAAVMAEELDIWARNEVGEPLDVNQLAQVQRRRDQVAAIMSRHGCELDSSSQEVSPWPHGKRNGPPVLRVHPAHVAGYERDRQRMEQCAAELEAAGITHFVV